MRDLEPELDADDRLQPREPDGEQTLPSRDRIRSQLGSIFLLLGVAIFSLLAADDAIGLPIRMPRSWYSDRALWVAAGLLGIGGGWYLMKSPNGASAESMTPAATTPRGALGINQVVLYTRPGCHLCEIARQMLEKYAVSLPVPQEVNIDSDPRLRERFSTCIPVVEIDGKIRFRGRINEILLRRLIRAKDEG